MSNNLKTWRKLEHCGLWEHLLNHANDASYKNSVGFHEKININTSILLTECSKAQMTDLRSWNEPEIKTEMHTVFSALFLMWKNKRHLELIKTGKL